MSIEILNPGSKAAQRAGCTCPTIDNHYGKGFDMGDGEISFVMVENCPLHGFKVEPEINQTNDDFSRGIEPNL